LALPFDLFLRDTIYHCKNIADLLVLLDLDKKQTNSTQESFVSRRATAKKGDCLPFVTNGKTAKGQSS